MSRTFIHKQCRSLPKTLPPNPSLHHENIPYHGRAVLYQQTPRNSHSSPSRRLVHTATKAPPHSHSARASGHPTPTHDTDYHGTRKLKEDLRLLLRDIAQPVAVVTSFMPADSSVLPSTSGSTTSAIPALHNGTGTGQPKNDSKYHGATLSSFTSIAMDPFPLVAFALRIPSRMATTLSSLASPIASSSSLPPTSPQTSTTSKLTSHMVINLLSASQASTAITFSRPDLYPTPFTSGSQSESLKYTLNEDGLPVLHGVVGALSCKLVGAPIPLHDLDYFSNGPGGKAKQPVLGEGDVASELFIARIIRVEDVRSLDAESEEDKEGERERTLPLIYHRRHYTSCHSRLTRIHDKKR